MGGPVHVKAWEAEVRWEFREDAVGESEEQPFCAVLLRCYVTVSDISFMCAALGVKE